MNDMNMKKLFLVLLCVVSVLVLCACGLTDSAYQQAYDAGFKDGAESGYKDGYSDGLSDGEDSGYEKGYSAGLKAGKQSGGQYSLNYSDDVLSLFGSSSDSADYILNKSSKKFHYPWCSSVSDMKESNKIYFTGTRDDAIAKGYTPCKRCNP